ncbi:MAG: hypothetical protein JSW33_13190 [bacterium]|nr:MAG: hypothetical protein JSW33_13190 [bacterium]
MNKNFQTIVNFLINFFKDQPAYSIIPPSFDFEASAASQSQICRSMSLAFMVILTGSKHPAYKSAREFLEVMNKDPEWQGLARFYLQGDFRISAELENITGANSQFSRKLKETAAWLSAANQPPNNEEVLRRIHAVFFPESVNLFKDKKKSIQVLRKIRKVSISDLNSNPIRSPNQEILFTANVLLTVPDASQPIEKLSLSEPLKKELENIVQESQAYWYDHPIPIGVAPEKNEVLYGLRGLDEAISFEKVRGNVPEDGKITCLLSVSVTHHGLHRIARLYLQEELNRYCRLNNLRIFIFTETDTEEIRHIIRRFAIKNHINAVREDEWLKILGVDGEYGRHYSFLKAIAALWQVMIDGKIKATFKIDLDQVFPQNELVQETGHSAFEHFQSPLWGAMGVDYWGRKIELGMIAGALVNEKDIKSSLFTPDVTVQNRPLTPDEFIFYSSLPQAASTEAEMMTRYNTAQLDGIKSCLQRIHVTGGTNGILIDVLMRYRPFTPSFIGRAEDQAYILPQLARNGINLGYVHKDGLIMRHDKEAFAQEAIKKAHVGKLIGDFVRILYFSKYARIIDSNLSRIKEKVDPFTGCFISHLPMTVVYLRFTLKALTLFSNNRDVEGMEFLKMGAQRIEKTIQFTQGDPSRFQAEYEKEKHQWDIYYDILLKIQTDFRKRDPLALSISESIRNFITQREI